MNVGKTVDFCCAVFPVVFFSFTVILESLHSTVPNK